MKKVLNTVIITIFTMLVIIINLLVVQFFYEAINNLSLEIIVAMFLIGSTTIMLDCGLLLAVLDIKGGL